MSAIQFLLFVSVLLAPGLLLAKVAGASAERLLVAVPVTCGLAYVAGNYLGAIDIPVYPLVPTVLIGSPLVVMFTRREWTKWRCPASRSIFEVATLVAGGLVLVLVWRRGSGSFGQLLPNHDAMYHSYVIKNIIETNSVRVADALRLFPVGSGTAASFYPLGLHGAVAQATRFSGAEINSAMNATVIVAALLGFPLSMHVWTRRLVGPRRGLALATALAVTMLSPIFPFSPFSWGGMPVIVAMSVAPAAAVALDAHLTERTRAGRLFTVAVLVGMFSIHTPELVLVLLMVVVLHFARRAERHDWWRSARELVVLGLWCAVAIAPVVLATAGGAAERNLTYQTKLDLVTNVGQTALFGLTGIALPLVAVLVFFGLGRALHERLTHVAVGYSAVFVAVVVAGHFPDNGLNKLVTKPWYNQVLRINYNIVYFAVPALVLALLLVVRPGRRVLRIATGVVVAFVAVGGLRSSFSADSTLIKSWYGGLVPPNQNSIDSYKWMASRLGRDEYVLTDYDGVDGSTWMYALTGARPVMYGAIADVSRDSLRSTKIAVIASVGSIASHPELVSFVHDHGLRYLYFDERTNAVSPKHSFTLAMLRSDPALVEVHSQGNAHVFEFRR